MIDRRTPKRRLGRWVALALAATMAAVTIALGGALAVMRTETGRAWLAERLAAVLSTPGEVVITIEGLGGRLPGEIAVARLTVADAAGVWLEARDLAVDWRPLALLERRLHVVSASAGVVEVARGPSAGAARPPAGLPRLPVALAVERLAVARIALADGVLGDAMSLRLEGRVAAPEPGRVTTALVIEHDDGGAGRAELSATYFLDDDRLALDLAANEPAGGLIARAMALPGAPPLALSLVGDGTLADWQGDATLVLDGLGGLAAEVRLRRGLAFAVSGAAASPWLAERVPGGLLDGAFTLAIAGRADGRRLVLERVALDGERASVEAAGTLGLGDLAVTATLNARLDDSPIWPGARAEAVVLTLGVEGPLFAPRLEATARLAALSAPDLGVGAAEARAVFVPAGPLNRGAPRGRFEAEGAIEGLTGAALGGLGAVLSMPLSWAIEGTLDAQHWRLSEATLRLRSGAASLDARGAFDLVESAADAELTVAIGDLGRLGSLVGLYLAGETRLAGTLRVRGVTDDVRLALSGATEGFRLGLPLADALFAGAGELALTARWQRGLRLERIRLAGPKGRLEGGARFDAALTRVDADFELAITDAGVLAEPLGASLAGPATVTGRLSGPLAEPRLDGHLVWSEAVVAGAAFDRVEATFDAAGLAGLPQGHLAAGAIAAFGPITAQADYRLDGAAVALDRLDIAASGVRGTGTVSVPFDGGPLTGALHFDAPRLGPALAVAGLVGDGAATAEVRLGDAAGVQTATLRGEAGGLALGLADGRVVTVDELRLSGRLRRPWEAPAGALGVAARGVASGSLGLDEVSLRAEGTPAQARTALALEGTWDGPLALSAAGDLALGATSASLDLASLEGRVSRMMLRLDGPARLVKEADRIAIRNLVLAVGQDARLGVDGEIAPERIALRADLDGLPVAGLAPLWPALADVAGQASASIAVEGSRSAPVGRLRLGVRDLVLTEEARATPLALTLDGDWRDGRLRLDGRVAGLPERSATIEATLPLRLDAASLIPVLPEDEPLSARLFWHGEMASLWALLPFEAHRLSGATELRAAVSGTLAAPSASGSFRLADGAYESLDLGTLVRDLDLTVEAEGERLILRRLQANDGGEGTLSAEGAVTLDPAQAFPFTLATEFAGFALVRRDDVTATADGRLSLAGTAERMGLAGRFETRSVEVRIPDRLPPEVAELPVTEVGGASGRVAAPTTAPAIALDLAVAMPRRVFIRGRGIDSEWAGALAVGGSAARPDLAGELTLVRGQLTVIGKVFRLVSGRVRFPGGVDAVPEIDVVAEHRARDLTVSARLDGPVTAPAITLSSVPALPRDEIVARVLFGKGSARLSAFEAAQLAAAIAELSGQGPGIDPLGFARRLLGADVLTVEAAAGSAGAAVEAGKYVAEDVYVHVKKGVADAAGAVGVEVELTPNVSIQSETGITGESDIGIRFEWDY